jgi:hypothetical protein
MISPPNSAYVGPVSAQIDNNNVLTVNWLPPAGPDYASWEIILNGIPTASILAPNPYTGTPRFYTTTLAAGSYTMDMQTNLVGSPVASFDWEEYNATLNTWQSVASLTPPYLAFPDAITPTDVTFSSTTLELGQPLTLQLNSAYVSADQWQVLWPDGSSTGWLPLSASLLTKQFAISGPLDVVIQTRYLYTSSIYSPPVTLQRQLTIEIFVVDQQYTGTTTTSTSLTGTLGIGGQQGFEITGATGVAATANPWEVVARAVVRDTVTNELKLLVATTRFSNASSLLGTMGIDVFPIASRPKNKELIAPVYENSFNALTSSIPVNITTAQLPTDIYVGKAMAEFQMAASGGNTPYAWYTDGLPAGLKLSINGVLSGTPLALGTYSINFAVQDASVPFFIAEAAFPITISTDLLVEIALGQTYTIFTSPTASTTTPLSQLVPSLGVAQVNTPYSVLMTVGNVNPSNPIPGGLPPYTWSIPAGNLPIGLSINPSTGLISGTPSTYNSTTDYTKTFSAVVQVTDAIGAIATQTYTMTLVPAALQFGNLAQPTIYAGQQFKLVIPIFGGISPYSFNYLIDFSVPLQDQPYYGIPVLVDGQIEMDVNFPNTALGIHTFELQITDSLGHTPSNFPTQFTVTVDAALSDPFLVPAYVDHIWGNPDVSEATPFPITGVFNGFTIGGTNIPLTSVPSNAAGGQTTYTYTGTIVYSIPSPSLSSTLFAVSGFQNAANNGAFAYVSNTSNTITLSNPNGVAENLFPFTYVLTSAATAVQGAVTDPEEFFIPTTTYTGVFADGAGNALAGQQFVVSGFTNAGNNGTFYCVNSTTTTLVLANGNGVAETLSIHSYPLTSAVRSSGTSPVATELGPTLASYALLGYAGITNSGNTVVSFGNIGAGTGSSSITGFNPPGLLTPPAVIDNADTGAAQIALTAAIAYYQGLVSTPISAVLDGQTLTPGVYSTGAATLSGGTLTLNGAGVYVIVMSSTLSLTGASQVVLTGGATADNVVFVCGSSFTAAANAGTLFNGNILAVASVTVNGGTYNGRLLANNGAVTISNATAINVPVTSSGLTTVYTGTFIGSISGYYVVSGFDFAGNNGTFLVVSHTSSTLTLVNPNGSTFIDYPAGSPPSASAIQSGIAVQSTAKALIATSLANGITVAVDPLIPEVEFTGTSSGVFGNVQYSLPILLTRDIAGVQVTAATFSQTYSILDRDNNPTTWAARDLGATTVNTAPYIVNQLVNLNPRQPYYNSPNAPSLSPVSPPLGDGPWVATVQSGSSLPPGLSLDANTGLIYGTLIGVATSTSVIQYVGTSGIVHGRATITWNTVASAFPCTVVETGAVTLGTQLSGTTSSPTIYIAVPGNITPITASVYYARGSSTGGLPAGLTLSSTPSGQNFYITGTPQEGGYFDVWFQVIGSTGISYVYYRLSVVFIEPLIIVNSALPTVASGAYFAQLQGFGGVPPYTWSSPTNFPGGIGTGVFAGLTLSSAGVLAGTLATPPTCATPPCLIGDLDVTLTDSNTPPTSVTDGMGYQPTLNLYYDNALRIITNSPWGVATVTNVDYSNNPTPYSFQVQGAGGTPPYSWSINPAATLPGGINFDSIFPLSGSSNPALEPVYPPDGGWFYGTWNGAVYPLTAVTVTLTDSVPNTVFKTFNIRTGLWTIGIDASGVGPIPRGESYQGSLAATGTFTLPIQWEVAPTTQYTNVLPAGLSIQANGTGATAIISGTYSGAVLVNYPVRVIAVDILGNTAESILMLNTDTNLTIIGWDYSTPGQQIGVQPFPLPNAVITGNYSGAAGPIQLVAVHGVPLGVLPNGYNQYNWSSVPSFPFNGISLSGSGVLSGVASTLFSQSFVFTASDSLTPPNTASYTTTFKSQTSALVISTASLPNATAGVPYSFQLQQTGAVGAFTFSIVGGALPSGLTMNSAGLISNTTLALGPASITFRVTDSTGAYYNRTLTLTVASGLTLKTGIDYEDSTSHNILGYVDKGNVVSIAPRTNYSFYVVATGVITTNPAMLGIIVSGGFGVGTVTISGGVALIPLTGPFSSGALGGSNSLSVSVTDSGVTATGTFTWVVYDDGALRLVANNAFPVKLTTPN